MKKIPSHSLWAAGTMLVLFLAAIAFRPLLPIDETRYMTVAWEMRLHGGWLSPLTMNFEPYHHKPPFLFWMINLFWSVFGISRWAGLIPVVLSSLAVVLLTIKLGRKILPAETYDPARTTFLILGSVPFLIYGTLVMFDLTLTAFVLASLLCLLNYAEKRKFRHIILMALFIGLGVLTKGPVAYLYIIFPILLGPLWVRGFERPVSWYGDCAAGLFASLLPVSLWLFPVLAQADNHFAFWLVWEQTAGRITGKFGDAHARPFYFYLPLIPLIFAPWVFVPSFWKNLKTIEAKSYGMKFLLCCVLPVFLSFSFISGKQPHYLIPLIPAVVLFLQMVLQTVSTKTLRNITLSMVTVLVAGQAVASFTVFKDYDLRPIAAYVHQNPDHPWAFVRNYHGEFGFLAELETPMTDLQPGEIDQWFEQNPDGMAVIRYKHAGDVSRHTEVFSQTYRGKNLGVFTR